MLKMTNWQYSTLHHSPCKVIEKQTLWGGTTCRVWLPGSDSVVRIPAVSYGQAVTWMGGK
jgi:hypothetical protein